MDLFLHLSPMPIAYLVWLSRVETLRQFLYRLLILESDVMCSVWTYTFKFQMFWISWLFEKSCESKDMVAVEVVKSTSLSLCPCSVCVIVINPNCQKRGHFWADAPFFEADVPFFAAGSFFALLHLHRGSSCHVTTTTKMASSSEGNPPTAKKPSTGPFSKLGKLNFYWNINL